MAEQIIESLCSQVAKKSLPTVLFYRAVQGVKLRSSSLAERAYSYWAILLAPAFFDFQSSSEHIFLLDISKIPVKAKKPRKNTAVHAKEGSD